MDGALLATADVPYYIFHVKLNAQNNNKRSSRTDADTQSKPSRTKPTHTIFTARNLFDACFFHYYWRYSYMAAHQHLFNEGCGSRWRERRRRRRRRRRRCWRWWNNAKGQNASALKYTKYLHKIIRTPAKFIRDVENWRVERVKLARKIHSHRKRRKYQFYEIIIFRRSLFADEQAIERTRFIDKLTKLEKTTTTLITIQKKNGILFYILWFFFFSVSVVARKRCSQCASHWPNSVTATVLLKRIIRAASDNDEKSCRP